MSEETCAADRIKAGLTERGVPSEALDDVHDFVDALMTAVFEEGRRHA